MLTIVFLSLVLLILTPWLKTSTLFAIIGLFGYFYYSGIDSWPPIILLVAGIILISLEVFIPRFGLLGIVGMISTVSGLYYTTGDISKTITDLSIALITSIVLLTILIRNGYSFKNWNRFVLNTRSKNISHSQNIEQRTNIFVGMVGETTTPLRPSGKVLFEKEDLAYDVLSADGHICQGVTVIVQEVHGTKIIVKKNNLEQRLIK